MGATLLISVLARPPSSSPGSPTVSQQGKDTVGGGNMNVAPRLCKHVRKWVLPLY